jgi:hypothetical protein
VAKNIVVYSDGTGQDGGVRPDQRLSNVYKLFRASRVGPDSQINPRDQIAFYDPGLGTDDDVHGLTKLKRDFLKTAGSVTGRGIADNIIDCYEFICNYWEPGDRIFLIGFSRGAYTVRCIAQLLALCGVPQHQSNDGAKPFERFSRATRRVASRAVHEVYEHGAGHPIAEFEAERDEKGRRFRAEFGSDVGGCANAAPYFIGVFDTVAALGAAGWKRRGIVAGLTFSAAAPIAAIATLIDLVTCWGFLAPFGALFLGAMVANWIVGRRRSYRYIDNFPASGGKRRAHHIAWHASNYDRGLSGHVGYARQASAIDETRLDFPRVPWGKDSVIRARVGDEPPPLVQLFFAGDHSDVGGSYVETESRLSDVTLEWMIEEATALAHPLLLDRAHAVTWPDATSLQHSEPVAVRQNYLWWAPSWVPSMFRQGWAEGHRVANGFPMHPSVFTRFSIDDVPQMGHQGPYRPPCLRADARFAPYWGDEDVRLVDATNILNSCSFEIGESGAVKATVGIASSDAGELLTKHSVTEGAIFLPGLTGVDDSEYFEGLANRWLLRDLTQQGTKTLPVAAVKKDGTSTHGLLALGVSIADSRKVARAIGQPAFLALSALGALSIVPTFG